MCLGDRLKDSGAVRMIGMTLIGLAILSKRYLPQAPGITPGAADFLTGLLYGMALPLLVLGIVKLARGR